MQRKLIIVAGPTASGKSELAVRLAKKFNGEIISADSRQVYRGLDIGTGKIEGKWRPYTTPHSPQSSKENITFIYKGIPHYCIDFVSPKKNFTAAEYKQCAEEAIKNIISHKKIPILVGGTGFWIDAVVDNVQFPPVSPNLLLRKKLEKKSAEELLKILKEIDPRRARSIEQKNPRRLIRAIEVARAIGPVPPMKKKNQYRALWIGINLPAKKLKKRIRKRLLQRINRGMIKEALHLHTHGLSWQRLYALGLEYRFLTDHLRGKLTKEEMRQKLERAILDYARRQMVWFRKKKIHWVKNQRTAERILHKFFQKGLSA